MENGCRTGIELLHRRSVGRGVFMNSQRSARLSGVSALDAVLLAVFLLVVGGGSMLLSAAESTTLVDGNRPWGEESFLRAVVHILCLGYQLPTINADEFKNYLLGIGAGLGALILGIRFLAKRTGASEVPDPLDVDAAPITKAHLAPAVAAQVLAVLYLLWSFASNGWSAAPEIAVGGSILLAIWFLWSFVLGVGLGHRAAEHAARFMMLVTAVVSLIAVAYYYGRNPVLRAKFPFGNPGFLAACLIPGMLLSLAAIGGALRRLIDRGPRKPNLTVLLAALMVIGLAAWAFALSDTRSAYVGLAAGILALAFFAFGRVGKWSTATLAVVLLVAAGWYYSQSMQAQSLTGRSETMRLRTYAWSYAMQMFNEKPLTGFGQGGFVLSGDERSVKDVLSDPLVFDARIAHAHNEWLEVMADLGAVGLVLIVSVLLLTLRAGAQALNDLESPPGQRWVLVGLLASLVALAASESFGVGLRVAGVPTYFYSIMGLIWAFARRDPSPLVEAISRSGWRRALGGATALALAGAALPLTHADFKDARNAHRVEQLIRDDALDEAVKLASLSVNRLNPQRRLEGLYRLGETHMLVARVLQSRADDRESRARQADVLDPNILALASDDRQRSDEHCRAGSAALNLLVRRSPGYFNHGWIAYWLNLIQSDNADARGDSQQQSQFFTAAGAALAAELDRQPFEPVLAEHFARVAIGNVPPPTIVEYLARPLRYQRITPYVNLLRDLSADDSFLGSVEELAQQARAQATGPPQNGEAKDPASDAPADPLSSWAPEKLRLGAALQFLRGNYVQALADVELAVGVYRRLAPVVLMGAAGGFEELAQCRFVSNPNDPRGAIESANDAISMAPESEPGRAMKRTVRLRMVEYLLAAGEETQARTLLRELGPPNASDEEVSSELGFRYRQLCQLFLLQRRDVGTLPKPVNDLLPKMTQWITRSIELNPEDPVALLLSADLSFHSGDDVQAAKLLRGALDAGLPPPDAARFIEVSLEKRPDSMPLKELLSLLQTAPNSGRSPQQDGAPSGDANRPPLGRPEGTP